MDVTKIEIQGLKAKQLLDRLDNMQTQLSEIQTKVSEHPNEILLSRQQVAKMLGISLMTLYTWTKKGILPAYRIGNKIKYKKSEVFESMELVNPKTPSND